LQAEKPARPPRTRAEAQADAARRDAQAQAQRLALAGTRDQRDIDPGLDSDRLRRLLARYRGLRRGAR
jgi:regulator of protease activity HflC (stomatin/prohibitin superfamily)